MKQVKQSETNIIVVVPAEEKSQAVKQQKINPSLLKAFSITIITLISWLNPEATIAILLVRLLLILLEWLNHKKV